MRMTSSTFSVPSASAKTALPASLSSLLQHKRLQLFSSNMEPRDCTLYFRGYGKRTVAAGNKHFVTTREVLQAVLKNLNGKNTKEEVQKKFTDCGLSLDGKYPLVDIVNKIQQRYNKSSSVTMGSEDEEYEANWVEALRQLAVGLHDDEALQVIAAAKKSMHAAHSKGTFSEDRGPRDINNNLVKTSGSFDSIRKSDKEEQKKRETELLKIIKDLKVEDEPLTPTQSEDSKLDEDNAE